MTFRQGALVLVMAGLLGGCVAPAKKSPPVPTAAVCPAENAMVQTTLYFGLSRPAGKDITARSGSSLLTATSRRAFVRG
jgi:hypothetical protein